jgi:flagellar hook-associated protein 2
MLRDQLLNSIYPTDGTSLSSLGIQVDRSGNLTFDSAAFASAYAADPVGVAAKFTTGDTTQGFAARVQSVAKAASDSTSGSITSVITGKNSTIKAMQDSIDDWDTRLALRRDTLNAQYTAMETAMNTLKSQSSWLTSQISALPTNNKES